MIKGSHLSEESKRKISEAKKGKSCGPRSEGVKRKISEATKGVKKTLTGPNKSWFPKGDKPTHGFKKGLVPWNTGKLLGNSRGSNKCKIWKKQVLERDMYQCVKCGSNDRVHAHHIVPWKKNDKLRFDVNNGLTLCNSCHSKEECVLGIDGIGNRYKKGHTHSLETRKKLSISHIGKIPWNKKIQGERG